MTPPKGRFDVRTIVAVLGGIAGLLGIYLGWITYFAERPNMSLRFMSAVLVSSGLDITAIPEHLARIEEDYGKITAGYIVTLRDEALKLNAKDENYAEQLDSLRSNLQQVIKKYDHTPEEWALTEITYKEGVVTWPDDVVVNFNNISDGYLVPSALHDTFERAAKENDEDAVETVLKFSYEFYQPWLPEHRRNREDVARKLRQIRTAVDDIRENRGRRIQVDVTVDNRSRLASAVQKGAILRIYKDKAKFKDLDVHLIGAVLLDSLSVQSISFKSAPWEMLDETTRAFLAHAYEKEYRCILFVEDLHQEVWHADGLFSSLRQPVVSHKLRSRIETVFKDHELH